MENTPLYMNEEKFSEVMTRNAIFRIPLFQRNYSWEKDNWETLWEDIKENIDENNTKKEKKFYHFMGIVFFSKKEVKGVYEFGIVDGQQRILTLLIILRILQLYTYRIQKDAYLKKLTESPQVFQKTIDHYFKISTNDKAKIYPSKQDQQAYDTLLALQPGMGNKSMFTYAENNDTCDVDSKDGRDLIPTINTDSTSHRMLQAYSFFRKKVLESDISVQAILDAIANLTFVLITTEQDIDLYRMFASLNGKGMRLTQADLIRNDIFMHWNGDDAEKEKVHQKYWCYIEHLLENISLSEFIRHYLLRSWSPISTNRLCEEFHEHFPTENAEKEKFLDDLKTSACYYLRIFRPEAEKDLDIQEQLERLKQLKMTIYHPLILNAYHMYDVTKTIGKEEFIRILNCLENYTIRNSIYHAKSVNKQYMANHMGNEFCVQTMHDYLFTKGYPDDAMFITCFEQGGWIKRSYTKPYATFIANSLGIDLADAHHLSNLQQFTSTALQRWPYFGPKENSVLCNLATTHDPTGYKPSRLIIQGREIVVSTWKDVLMQTLCVILGTYQDQFFHICEACSIHLDLTPKFSSYGQLPNGYYVNTNYSALIIRKKCYEILQITKMAEGWQIVGIKIPNSRRTRQCL